MKRWIAFLAIMCVIVLGISISFAKSDATNGDWSAQNVTLKNTKEAELMVRVGDIDALNTEDIEESNYNPFSAASQLSHGYPWGKDDNDFAGTDRIYLGSAHTSESVDGYADNYNRFEEGEDTEHAYGKGAMQIPMTFDASGITIKNAILQICIDDFQALSFDSNFTVKINGKDAPFIAELLNHVDQTGPTSYIISSIIPQSFYEDIQSGKLTITIDETTGVGDGFAVDFVKLLVNYDNTIFTGKFTGTTTPGATVRLLGTATTVVASSTGGFEFEAIPGLNAIRCSKEGYVEGYAYGIVISSQTVSDDEKWEPAVDLEEGKGNADIDFSQFGTTNAWENASAWATQELEDANQLGLIPEILKSVDLTKSITREEFAAVSVKAYEALTGNKATPVSNNPFTDTKNEEVLKAYQLGITTGTSATTFDPNALLNREQAATMLTRTYKKATIEGWTIATDGNYTLDYTKSNTFADDKDISDWAKDSVYFMNANSIINGVGENRFAPKNTTSAEEAVGYANATREQAIIIATRMVKNLK